MAKQTDARSKAKSLFLTDNYTLKEIASMCGVSANTITDWKQKDSWDDHKLSLLTTRESELRRLYMMLRKKNDEVEMKEFIDNKDSNVVIQLTAAIKNLEIETSVAEKVQVGTAFITMVRHDDPELAKTITKWFDVFLSKSK